MHHIFLLRNRNKNASYGREYRVKYLALKFLHMGRQPNHLYNLYDLVRTSHCWILSSYGVTFSVRAFILEQMSTI